MTPDAARRAGDTDGFPAGAIPNDDVTALSTEVYETARLLFAAGGVGDTLQRIMSLSASTIEGRGVAGILLLDRGALSVAAAPGTLAAELDEAQRTKASGPSVDAINGNVTAYADDLATERRWPNLAALASSRSIRSALALPLRTDRTIGALTLYADRPRAFAVLDRARGLLLASSAAFAVGAARDHEQGERREAEFHAALATREIIGQAQGILIERDGITAAQAFDVLRRASQHLNVKLSQVAQTLVDTGQTPDTGPAH